LAFVLHHSAAARQSLQQMLSATASQEIPVARVSPQFMAGDESRPDLATFGPDGALTAFLEAKFWAGLTDAQPVDYLRRLGQSGGKVLLFIVPEERMASVSFNLAERARAASIPLTSQPRGGEALSVTTPTGSRMIVVSWRTLLTTLRSGCERAEDRRGVADLDQLAGLVERFEADGFAPMSPAELTDLSMPRRVRALAALVQAVIAKGEARKLISRAGTRPTHDWTSAGRYMGLPHGYAWIGVDHDAWAQYQSTPLWLWFPATEWGRASDVRRALQSWEATNPRRLYVNEDESVSVPLFVRPGTEQDEVVEDLLRQLANVDGALEAAGVVRADAAPAPQA
jgi:hypothetical protein